MLTITGRTYGEVLANLISQDSLSDHERSAVETLASWVREAGDDENLLASLADIERDGLEAGKLDGGTRWFATDGITVYVHPHTGATDAMNVWVKAE